MRHLFVSSLLGIFLAVLGGCVKKDIPTTGAIHGVVKDSESAQPLVGCSVMLMPTGATTVTGTDGSFHFQDILPDTYSVEVSCHGYYTNKKSIIVGVSDASMSVDILLTRFDPNNRLAELGAMRVAGVTFRSARVECEIIEQGSSSIAERGFLYSETPDITIATATKQIVKTTENIFSATLNNLAENTDYYVAAYAINGRGTAYSEVVKFTTGDASSITAPTNVIYVSVSGNDANDGKSWSRAKKTLQAAIDLATDQDQIWVSVGNYDETIYPKSGVPIYGGFKGSEKSISERTEKTTAAGIKGSCLSETIVDGFYFKGTRSSGVDLYGNVFINNCNIDAALCSNGENNTISNCNIDKVSWLIGALGIFYLQGEVTMINCFLRANHREITVYGNLKMYNCVITNNGNVFATKNSCSIDLYNCTLANNEWIFKGSKGGNLYNCLIWNDWLSENSTQYSCIHIENTDNSKVKIKRPSTKQGYDAPDWQTADWSIEAGSSCIDQGVSLYLPSSIKTDLAGNDRISGKSIDIGAYEY